MKPTLEWKDDHNGIIRKPCIKADSVAAPVYEDTGMNRPYRIVGTAPNIMAFAPSGLPDEMDKGKCFSNIEDAKEWCEEIERDALIRVSSKSPSPRSQP